MTEKRRIQRLKFTKGNGHKARIKENGLLYICSYLLQIHNDNHTQRLRTEVNNRKQANMQKLFFENNLQ